MGLVGGKRPQGSTVNDAKLTQRGRPWVVAQNLLTMAVLLLAPLFCGQWRGRAATGAGVVLFGAGAAFGIAGVRALGRNRTPYPRPLENSTLVHHGVYGIVRHPLYSSLMCASVGWALLWSSWVALAAAFALVLLLRAKAVIEERWLRERYPEYRDYERRVKRFVPGVW
jgi:protein-S-isoprenylcysteine O-methyltransferase Ste14